MEHWGFPEPGGVPLGPGGQQMQYILEDDHDLWPVHPGLHAGMQAHPRQQHPQQQPGVPSGMVPVGGGGMQVAQPLGALPPVGSHPPGKPVMVPVDDEATESEGERRPVGPGAAAAMAAWGGLGSTGRRPVESGATGTSQPSPTQSVSLTAPMSAAAAPAAGPARKGGSKSGSKGGPRRVGSGKSAITLRLLIEEGVLQPGHNVLSVDYKGMKQLASLQPDGRISSSIGGQQLTFESPSAFSIYLKRLLNPTRKADDGWKTVRYNGRVLEQFKAELAQRRLADGNSGGGASAGTAATASEQRQQAQQPAKRARVDSSSDLTGGSVALSASFKDGDRNVLKLKFARSKKQLADSAAQPGGGYAAGPYAAQAQAEDAIDYQRSRPRRQVQAPPRYAALGLDDEHALQPLEAYGPGHPGMPGAQPYTVWVSPTAEVTMDAHAHLCMNEVIGVLAGEYDAGARTISVLRAHPVLELATEDNSINVEMDPEDEWRVRQQIEDDGMRAVGWYHSHPTFPTQPSTIDIYNQVLQQHHHRDERAAGEPYIAAIVGPYDRRLGSPQSSITWFYVDHAPGRLPAEGQRPDDVGCVAKALQTLQLVQDGGRAVAEIAAMPTCGLLQLARRYAGKRDAADMAGIWRDGITRVQKFVASLQSRLPPAHWGPNQLYDLGCRLYDMISTTMIHGQGLPRPPSTERLSGAAGGGDSEDEAISSDDD